jgi:hypothetical protein
LGDKGVAAAFVIDEDPDFAAAGDTVAGVFVDDDDFTLAVVELLRELGTKGDGPTVLVGLDGAVVDAGRGDGGVRPRVVGRGMCFDF